MSNLDICFFDYKKYLHKNASYDKIIKEGDRNGIAKLYRKSSKSRNNREKR